MRRHTYDEAAVAPRIDSSRTDGRLVPRITPHAVAHDLRQVPRPYLRTATAVPHGLQPLDPSRHWLADSRGAAFFAWVGPYSPFASRTRTWTKLRREGRECAALGASPNTADEGRAWRADVRPAAQLHTGGEIPSSPSRHSVSRLGRPLSRRGWKGRKNRPQTIPGNPPFLAGGCLYSHLILLHLWGRDALGALATSSTSGFRSHGLSLASPIASVAATTPPATSPAGC